MMITGAGAAADTSIGFSFSMSVLEPVVSDRSSRQGI